MFDFSGQIVTADSRCKYTFTDIPGRPKAWMEMKPALEPNEPFFNAVLARAGKALEMLESDVDGDKAVMLEESREEDRELYPGLVCGDKWGGVVRQPDGTEIDLDELECNLEHRTAFITALPYQIFDKLRQHCGRADSFYAKSKPKPPTAKKTRRTAKN